MVANEIANPMPVRIVNHLARHGPTLQISIPKYTARVGSSSNQGEKGYTWAGVLGAEWAAGTPNVSLPKGYATTHADGVYSVSVRRLPVTMMLAGWQLFKVGSRTSREFNHMRHIKQVVF